MMQKAEGDSAVIFSSQGDVIERTRASLSQCLCYRYGYGRLEVFKKY